MVTSGTAFWKLMEFLTVPGYILSLFRRCCCRRRLLPRVESAADFAEAVIIVVPDMLMRN